MDGTGRVYLVGAGPGDPELITKKGIRLLQKCEVVIYDRLISIQLLNYVKEGCEKIYVGKTVGNHSVVQEEINQIMIEKAFEGKIVVRLKGGDPFVFGRGGEEVIALESQGIPFEVVPGVTSAIAAATYAGIPLTHRGFSQGFTVITGHTADPDSGKPEDFEVWAKLKHTLVILMGLGNLGYIVKELVNHGKTLDTPVAVVANGTTCRQKEVRGDLRNICQLAAAAKITAPAIIIIGKVAQLDMRSSIKLILSGVRVGVTGTKESNDKLTDELEELGAQVETVSLSEIKEYEDNTEFENALKSISKYNWIVLTSTNAVHICFKRMLKLIDFRSIAHLKFAVIGSGTEKALLQYGFQADYKPMKYSAADLAMGLCKVAGEEERLLIPRAQKGSIDLIHILEENKRKYEDITIYDVVSSGEYTEDLIDRIANAQYITFTSSSGVHGFFKELKTPPQELLVNKKLVCIGDITANTLKEYGYNQVLIADEYNINGLVKKICDDHYGANEG